MRKVLFAFAVPCLLAGLASADGITTSTSCSVSVPSTGAVQTMTGPTACGVSLGAGSASAAVSYSLYLPLTTSSSGYIGASISAYTNPTPSSPAGYSSTIATEMSADASITLQYTLSTAGPVRPGYVEIDRLLSSAGTDERNAGGVADNYAMVQASIGSAVSVSCPQEEVGEECAPSSQGTFFPITLGQPFVFTEQIILDASDSVGGLGVSADYGDFLESGDASLGFSFQLLEADESTPVLVQLAPEPNTWSLLAAAAFTALLVRLSRRRTGRTLR